MRGEYPYLKFQALHILLSNYRWLLSFVCIAKEAHGDSSGIIIFFCQLRYDAKKNPLVCTSIVDLPDCLHPMHCI